ncbi:hypothetical protein Sjap_008802 [Stephania japonica]|uniref:Uncharacterized protein n=1 Tax=Stephania japonica TaxID=461633 RepID=A0AAP0JQ99_9MAGN
MMDGQTPPTPPTTQQEVGETSDHTTSDVADLRAMMQRLTEQQPIAAAQMAELMEYIRSSRTPAVAPTAERLCTVTTAPH